MALYGHVDQISRSLVEGWAQESDRPDEPVSVSVFVNGAHHGACLTIHTRSDLPETPTGTPPRTQGFRLAFDPPLSAFVAHRIEVRETWTGDLLPGGARTLSRPEFQGRDRGLRPIVLTSTGRSGTTMFMSELALHPDVVVGNSYPYEIKQIAYHAAAFRALVAGADRERSTNPDTMLSCQTSRVIGANPYNCPGLFDLARPAAKLREFYEDTVPVEYAALFQKIIREYYAILAASQRKYAASFFCEKGDINEEARQAARLFFDDVKEIVVVRDPRDLLCSSMAFWKLEAEEAMAMLRTTIPKLTRIARSAGPDTLVVRYEDLVLDPVATRQAVSDFLGLNPMGRRTPGESAILDGHRTSDDSAASVGRWQRDLSPELADACDSAFAPYMRAFDYPLGSRAKIQASSFVDRRRQADNEVLIAEGSIAVSALLADEDDAQENSTLSRRVLDLTFGLGEIGMDFVREGWSSPEPGFVWTNAFESHLLLPPILGRGEYRLMMVAAPFTHDVALRTQRVTVLMGGIEVGTADLRDISVLSIAVPAGVVKSKQAVILTLRVPNAARPSEVKASNDDRLLGLSLRRVTLSRADAQFTVSARQEGPVQYVRPRPPAPNGLEQTVRGMALALSLTPPGINRGDLERATEIALTETAGDGTDWQQNGVGFTFAESLVRPR